MPVSSSALPGDRRNCRGASVPASKWANPFSIKRETDRGVVIAAYERWLRLPPALHELKGRDLVCWCPPACHGSVLLRLLERPQTGSKHLD
jgi:hypothetical protein